MEFFINLNFNIMRNLNIKTSILIALVISLILNITSAFACTIVSGIAKNGHVWNANNEDGPFGVANFINVFPKTDNVKYGYYTFSYMSPKYGQNGNIQGGVNEAGLTFDFNGINYVRDFDVTSKKAFPKGDDAILIHILGNMKSVNEVINFFKEYWFTNGFRTAQMHVADKSGKFAIISASGIFVAKKGESLVSTNFDICEKENRTSCWRYPIAYDKITNEGASLKTMIAICKETAQKNGATMYSNVQNLTTGDVWFFSKHNKGVLVKTNIKDLLQKGRKSYTFSDLKSLKAERDIYQKEKFEKINLSESDIKKFEGSYFNSATGKIAVKGTKEGIEVSFANGDKVPMLATKNNTFFFLYDDFKIVFKEDKLKVYESGFWSFTAKKKE